MVVHLSGSIKKVSVTGDKWCTEICLNDTDCDKILVRTEDFKPLLDAMNKYQEENSNVDGSGSRVSTGSEAG